jgi:hypothetical protein
MWALVFIFLNSLLWGTTVRHAYATWEDDPRTTLSLHYHLIDNTEALSVHYRPLEGSSSGLSGCYTLPLYKKMLGHRKIYHVQLEKLSAGTLYELILKEGDQVIHKTSCRTLPEQGPYRFIEAGDWENTPQAWALASLASRYQPHGVWLGGDYPSGVIGHKQSGLWDQWLDGYQKYMVGAAGALIPFVMAIGNHEVNGGFGQKKEQAPFFFHYFRPCQESYFSLPIGDSARLFILDSGHVSAQGGVQKKWLQEVLEQYKNCPMKIALYHVPIYPSVRFTEKKWLFNTLVTGLNLMGFEKIENRLFSKISCKGQQEWVPLFDHYGLKLAFEHHDQALKRTHPLKNNQKDDSGTVYLGDGGFGCETKVWPIKGYFDPNMAHVQGKQAFFWLVTITDEKVTCEAISQDNRQLDRCEIK